MELDLTIAVARALRVPRNLNAAMPLRVTIHLQPGKHNTYVYR